MAEKQRTLVIDPQVLQLLRITVAETYEEISAAKEEETHAHNEDHVFLRLLKQDYLDKLDRHKKRTESYDRIKESILGWLVIVCIGGAGVLVWHGVIYAIKKGLA